MKVFISQPMREKTEKQILDERDKIIMDIKSEFPDAEIIDSYFGDDFNFSGIKNKPLVYLAKSLELLATADIAYFARNWKSTRGCIIEYKCAQDYGIEIRDGEIHA
jgi:hypothetical protein